MDKEERFLKEVIAYNIKRCRIERNLTQEQLAQKCQMSLSFINQIETGRGDKSISVVNLYRLAEALEVGLNDLVIDNKNLKYYGPKEYLDEKEKILEYIHDDYSNYYQVFYPPKDEQHTISRLNEFLIYLPLIDIYAIDNINYRLGGDIVGKENYMCNLLDQAISIIPEDDAKAYADYMYEQIQKKAEEGATETRYEEYKYTQTEEYKRKLHAYQDSCKTYRKRVLAKLLEYELKSMK